jgi:hypothetical protein
MEQGSNARSRAQGVLTEFVEAAEPKRQRKIKRNWWWNPGAFRYRKIEFWPSYPDMHNGAGPNREVAEPDPSQVVVLPPYGARFDPDPAE